MYKLKGDSEMGYFPVDVTPRKALVCLRAKPYNQVAEEQLRT